MNPTINVQDCGQASKTGTEIVFRPLEGLVVHLFEFQHLELHDFLTVVAEGGLKNSIKDAVIFQGIWFLYNPANLLENEQKWKIIYLIHY